MKGKMSVTTMIGILIYVVYSIADRFIIEVPNIIAIPTMILGIVLIISGNIKTRTDDVKNDFKKTA